MMLRLKVLKNQHHCSKRVGDVVPSVMVWSVDGCGFLGCITWKMQFVNHITIPMQNSEYVSEKCMWCYWYIRVA